MLELRPIRTEADYRVALDEIERLFDAKLNTLEYDRLEVLTTLVEAYEQRHYQSKHQILLKQYYIISNPVGCL
jgi:HTH-type transcriptional regulator / antitoxin HigA